MRRGGSGDGRKQCMSIAKIGGAFDEVKKNVFMCQPHTARTWRLRCIALVVTILWVITSNAIAASQEDSTPANVVRLLNEKLHNFVFRGGPKSFHIVDVESGVVGVVRFADLKISVQWGDKISGDSFIVNSEAMCVRDTVRSKTRCYAIYERASQEAGCPYYLQDLDIHKARVACMERVDGLEPN